MINDCNNNLVICSLCTEPADLYLYTTAGRGDIIIEQPYVSVCRYHFVPMKLNLSSGELTIETALEEEIGVS